MDDTRTRQARALIDDARTLLNEILDEICADNLEAAKQSLNVALKHIHIWEASDGPA